MTRFDYFTQSPERLAELLDLVQSDGLAAKGCSLELLLPPNETGSWHAWLEEHPEPDDAAAVFDELQELTRRVELAAMEADYE